MRKASTSFPLNVCICPVVGVLWVSGLLVSGGAGWGGANGDAGGQVAQKVPLQHRRGLHALRPAEPERSGASCAEGVYAYASSSCLCLRLCVYLCGYCLRSSWSCSPEPKTEYDTEEGHACTEAFFVRRARVTFQQSVVEGNARGNPLRQGDQVRCFKSAKHNYNTRLTLFSCVHVAAMKHFWRKIHLWTFRVGAREYNTTRCDPTTSHHRRGSLFSFRSVRASACAVVRHVQFWLLFRTRTRLPPAARGVISTIFLPGGHFPRLPLDQASRPLQLFRSIITVQQGSPVFFA